MKGGLVMWEVQHSGAPCLLKHFGMTQGNNKDVYEKLCPVGQTLICFWTGLDISNNSLYAVKGITEIWYEKWSWGWGVMLYMSLYL